MKRTVLVFIALALTSSARGQDWNWQDIGNHVQAGHVQLELFESVQSISVVRYKASRYSTRIVNDMGGNGGQHIGPGCQT